MNWREKWQEVDSDGVNAKGYNRLLPIPQSRPWSKREDVPGGMVWLRWRADPGSVDMLVVNITDYGVMAGSMSHWSWDELQDMDYSHDRVTWRPCTVEVGT